MKMRWFLVLVVAVLSLVAPKRLFAQDLAGNWQGTMQIGREIRVVFKISNADGVLRAVMYSIDQGGQAIPASSVTLQGTTVRIAIPGIGGSYEGKLGADGNSIAGTTTQGPNKMTLNLVRATAATAWAIPEPPAPPKPMAADAVAAFEVATIKPSQPNAPGRSILVRGRQFSTTNTTLADLIGFTYGVHAKQIVGGPGWLETEKFDITARPAGDGQPNEKQWKAMLQKLLAERFNLAFHPDKQELAVFAFTVLKTGPKLTPSTGDPNGLPGLGFRGPGAMIARNATVRDLAATLQMGLLDRPVVDQTGIPGRYDFTLTFTPDDFQFGGAKMPPPTDGSAPPPNMFTAIQEQLGLKLETTRAAADVLAIDRVEKPSPD